ncbi:MAG: XdhC family protein [Chitinophagaceae bacterium]|nr:XdhC family protein [Chitinophagaceae bacterium]
MKHLKTWKLIHQSLIQKIPVMLLYVLESKGSSPGRQGFFMAVNLAGEMEGSIGGGIMEHKFVEMARETLRHFDRLSAQGDKTQKTDIRKQYHDKLAAKDQSGMICSGEQTILLHKVKEAEEENIQQIIASLEANKNETLVLSPGKLNFEHISPGKHIEFTFLSEDDWLYKEKTGYKYRLSIIGGGHCSLALSRLMRSLDFYICVYDDRKELNTMMENDTAHEKHFIPDYTVLKDLIKEGDEHYVVVMTFGYRTDDTALRSLLFKDFKYMGLLGSQHKSDKLFEDYRAQGVPEERLQRIQTPAGLAIKSQSPEEIAVSIAAQIIQVKNQDT